MSTHRYSLPSLGMVAQPCSAERSGQEWKRGVVDGDVAFSPFAASHPCSTMRIVASSSDGRRGQHRGGEEQPKPGRRGCDWARGRRTQGLHDRSKTSESQAAPYTESGKGEVDRWSSPTRGSSRIDMRKAAVSTRESDGRASSTGSNRNASLCDRVGPGPREDLGRNQIQDAGELKGGPTHFNLQGLAGKSGGG